MHVETTIELLDQYLLTGQVALTEVEACLARHQEMPYLRHLELTELDTGLPEDSEEAFRRLIRLRLLFADHLREDSLLPERLLEVCQIYRRVQAYVRNEIGSRDLEQQIMEVSRNPSGNAEIAQLLWNLRGTIAEDPEISRRVDCLNACFKTLHRLEAYWSAILDSR